jgi:hypothetical protein
MKKSFLIKWDLPEYFALHDYVSYTLHFEVIWLWGFFTTYKQREHRLYEHHNHGAHYKHWDNMINDRIPIKLKE